MGPIRGQTRPMPVEAGVVPEIQRIDAKLNASIHNRFDIEVINAETGEVRQRAQAENVICNQLWACLLSGSNGNYFQYIQYGSGSGTPSASDTALFTYAGYGSPAASDDVFMNNTAECWCSCCRKIQLSESTAVGTTLSEVGIAYSTSGSLVTHAMLKDMNGNQITIAKTNTDIINIYATIFVHYAATGDNGKLRMCPLWTAEMEASVSDYYGASNRLLAYLLGIEQWPYINSYSFMMASSGSIGPFSIYKDNQSSIDNEQKTSSCKCSYTFSRDSAGKKLILTMSRLSVSDGNIGGIRSIAIGSTHTLYNSVVYRCLPWFVLDIGGSGLPVSVVTGESIATGDGSTKDFATDFDCVSSATVYVDGTPSAAATIDTGVPLDYSNMGKYFQFEPFASSVNLNYTPSFNNKNVAWDESSLVGYAVFYNPFYSLGVSSLTCLEVIISVSNDLINWTQIISGSQSGTISIASEYQKYKYWRIETTQALTKISPAYCYGLASAGASGKNIHFSTAPASGAVITADYTADAVAKDANHVFDLTVTIQLGEHTS